MFPLYSKLPLYRARVVNAYYPHLQLDPTGNYVGPSSQIISEKTQPCENVLLDFISARCRCAKSDLMWENGGKGGAYTRTVRTCIDPLLYVGNLV